MSEKRYYLKEIEPGEIIHNKFTNNIKRSSTTATQPDIISPIYQKVLGYPFVPGKRNGVPSPELDMTDPSAALKKLLRTERSFKNKPMALPVSISMTLPTCVSTSLPNAGSMTLPTSLSMIFPTPEPRAVPTSVPMTLPTSVSMTLPTSVSMIFPTSVSMTVPTPEPRAVPTSVPMTLPTSVSMTLPTSVSMTLPTSVSMTLPSPLSMTLPISVSSGNTMGASPSKITRLINSLDSRLDDEHMYPTNDPSTCPEARITVSAQQTCRSDDNEFSEKHIDSISDLQRNIVSPCSESRISEGDQTVPHSVSPARESPHFALDDECSAGIQATIVPPPEVLVSSNAGNLQTHNEHHMNQLVVGVNGIHSLDNYEYFIHKVDQHSVETQNKEKCPATNTGVTTIINPEVLTTSDICKDNSILDTNTETVSKASHCETDESKSEGPISIDSDEECYIIENNIPKSVRVVNGNISKNMHPDNNDQNDNQCDNDKKDDTPVIIAVDDDDDGKFDEELSEMRRYYLESDKEQLSDTLSVLKQNRFYTGVANELHTVSNREFQGIAAYGEINNDVHIHNLLRKETEVSICGQSSTQDTSLIDLSRGGSESDLLPENELRCKEMSVKRYYLNDESQNRSIEPGEVVHLRSTLSSKAAYCNESCGDYVSQHLDHGSKMRNYVTEYPETIPKNCIQSAVMSKKTPNHSRSANSRSSFNIKFVNSGNDSEDPKNSDMCYVSNAVGSEHAVDSKATYLSYSSVLFPVCIDRSGLHETENSKNSKTNLCLKRNFVEDINTNYVNESRFTSAVQSDSLQERCKSNNEFHTKLHKSCKSSKKTTRHINGIIEKLWVSKTRVPEQRFNALASNIRCDGIQISKSIHTEPSINIPSIITNTNPKKSQKRSVKMFECSTCGFQDKRYSGIEKHVVEKHRPDGCTCDSCGQTLINHCHCKGRFKIISKAATFECKICKKQCKTRPGLRQHKVKKHGYDVTSCLTAYQPPYTCRVCNEDQHVYSRYKEHMLAHGVTNPFKCKTCSKSFHSKSGLALHFSRVHQSLDSLH